MTYSRIHAHRLKFSWVGFSSLLLAQALWARPPVDQILRPPPRQKGVRIIRNKNVTYTQDQPETAVEQTPIITKYSVKGRSRPSRSGKVLSVLESGSAIIPIKWSKDKKWIAVKVTRSQVRVWIPVSALPALTDKLQLKDEPATTAAPKTSSRKSKRKTPRELPKPVDQPNESDDFESED